MDANFSPGRSSLIAAIITNTAINNDIMSPYEIAHAASCSSDFIRWICGGTFLPLENRNSANDREAFHRQRVVNIGASSTA